QLEARAHRTLGVVLVRRGKPEGGQDAIALDLDDVALELGLDHLSTGGAVPRHQLAVGLRLPAPRELGGSDDVAEQDRQAVQLADASMELVAVGLRPPTHGTVIHTVTGAVSASVVAFTFPP